MVDIFTGFGIVNSSHVTHWNFNENKNKNGFGIKAMSGDTTLCFLTCTEESLKEISIAPVLGLVYEVVSYSLEESKNTARPFHLWRVNQMAVDMMIIASTGVATGEDKEKVVVDEALCKILRAKEGAYVEVEGLDGYFTRVGAYMKLKELVPQQPALVTIHGSANSNITEIYYPSTNKMLEG